MEEWVQHLSSRKGSPREGPRRKGSSQKDREEPKWSKPDFRGPDDKDSNNCGVYVTWVLGMWLQGREVSAESYVDPLEYRMEIFQRLCHLPTVPGLVKVGEGKFASDSSPLHADSPPVHGTIVEPFTFLMRS